MAVRTQRMGMSRPRRARPVGQLAFAMDRRRSMLLAGVYVVGDLGVLLVWLIDPVDVGRAAAMAALMIVVAACAVTLLVLRDHLPAMVGDLAIVGSIVLITAANLFCRLDVHVPLFMPYYVWVGFVSPIWFPRRRAMLYVALTVAAAGLVAGVAGTAVAVASWVAITVTLIVAFVIVDSLTRALVERERLAAVGEMASVVSHELRNPLGAMANAVFLVRHALRGRMTVEIDQHLSMAEREIDKATAIIDHLVAFVRPRQPESGALSLRDVVAEVLETTPPPPGIECGVDVGTLRVVADRGHLTEILVNLVANAYDAMPGGGGLRIAARPVDQHARITVEDDGPGLDRVLSERIFEPFFTTKHAGTGLGLAIVRRLAEVNGGTVAVDTHVRGGTRFLVTLPLAPAAPARRSPARVEQDATVR